MATYLELFDLASNGQLRNKVAVAVTVAAEAIRTEVDTTVNHLNRMKWAKQALQNPELMARYVLPILLAQNAGLSSAQIQAATDATLQTAVNNSVNVFADGS